MIIKGVPLNELLSIGMDFWTTEKAARRTKELIWQECWLAYDSKFGDTWKELAQYRSRRYLALPWLAVENVKAKYTQGIMPNEDWFGLMGRTPDHDNNARFMQALMVWQQNKMRFRQKFAMAMAHATIFGNIPYQVKWDRHETNVPDVQGFADILQQKGMDLQNGLEPEMEMPEVPTKEMLLYDGPDFEIGNIFDFVIQRSPDSYERAMRAARFVKSKAHLKELAEPDEFGQAIYEGIDDLEDQVNNQENSDNLKYQVEAKIGFNQQNRRYGIELIEIWGNFALQDGTYYENHVLTIGNRSKVIRFEPNPFSHGQYAWQLFRLFPEPNEPYGRGILEPALGINDDIQVRMNQVIDANSLIINPMFKYKDDGILDPAELIAAPGNAIAMADVNNLQPVMSIDKSATGFQEINFLIAMFNQITGATNILDQAGSPVSATQANIEATMANARDAEVIRHIKKELVERLFKMWYGLNQQFMDQSVAVRVTASQVQGGIVDPHTGIKLQSSGPIFMNIQPQDIAGDFDFIFQGADDVAASAQKAAQQLQFIGTLLQNPEVAQRFKYYDFLTDIFARNGLPQAWRWLKTDQEVMLEQQQQLAMQQAAAAAGAGGPGGPQAGPGNAPQQQGGSGGPGSVAGVPESRPAAPGGPHPGQLAGPSIQA